MDRLRWQRPKWYQVADDLRFYSEFDEGHLSKDSVAAEEEVDQTMAIMTDTKPPVRQKDNPLRYIFQTCWDRLKRVFHLTHN